MSPPCGEVPWLFWVIVVAPFNPQPERLLVLLSGPISHSRAVVARRVHTAKVVSSNLTCATSRSAPLSG